MVSPMPSISKVAMPAVPFTMPAGGGPASVRPRWRGWSTCSDKSLYASTMSGTREAFTEIFTLSKPTSEQAELVECGLDKGLGRDAAVLFVEALVQRPCVHPYADRDAPVFALARDQLYFLGLAQVAGVEAQAVGTSFDGG